MHELLPEGDDIHKAVKWVSGNILEYPEKPVNRLVQEAIFRFDLSPKDSEFLMMFFSRKNDSP